MNIKNILLGFIITLPLLTSCVGDLDVSPLDSHIQTADKIYAVKENYKKSLFKIYSVLAMSGQEGAGSSDIDGLDAGNAQFYRSWWNLQQISTDECINAWPDSWVREVNEMSWTSKNNESIEGVYQRAMYIVAISNDYMKQTTDGNMSKRGIEEDFWPTVHGYRAEARFMRAFAYYILMDVYGNPPFITENNYSTAPSQIGRDKLFDWIESELKAILAELPEYGNVEYYGRATKGVVNALLSRMYLNAEVYTGVARLDDCIKVSKEVINSGYALAPKYADLFKADNNRAEVAKEFIFPIVFDGTKTQSYGGIRYLIASSRGPKEVSIETDGYKDGWSGNRALPTLVRKFEFENSSRPTASTIKDSRGIFFDENRSIEIDTWLKTFETEGWAVYKFTNLNSDGTPGTDAYSPDGDVPLFRLAEIYLNYAEAVLRGGNGGSKSEALQYVNDLRKRGYGNESGLIAEANLTLDFLLDERSRELYWEGLRRTDLVRYGYFTSNEYLWQFKGGVKNGTSIESHRSIFPIPASDLSVNGNLKQNPGYVNQ